MYNVLKEKSNKIEIEDGIEYLKKEFIFVDNNYRKINIETKVKGEIKKGNAVKIKVFDKTEYPRSLQISRKKRLVDFFCFPREILKRLNIINEFLRENGIKEETVLKLEKQKIKLAIAIYHTEKFKKNEKDTVIFEDNLVMIDMFISACLREIYEEEILNG